ncbi:MAG: histidine phosphatase family protein [Ardenticatenaceae bacterium]|nr:histidine phosphatase family protein [Ardenticatenaceae bacterium]
MSSSKGERRARLILLRHGQSLWNAEKRLAGQADIAVSEFGRQQIESIRGLIAALRPEKIVSSDLLRASQSAAYLGYEAPHFDPRLREAYLGRWQGSYIDDLPPDQYAAWRAGKLPPPQGESWAEFCDRVEPAFHELIENGGRNLLVTHGGVIRVACDRLLGLKPDQIVPVPPASVTIIDVYDRPRLSAYNLSQHIDVNRFD